MEAERLHIRATLGFENTLGSTDPNTLKATDNLARTFLKEFLFTMPTDDEQDKAPICDSSATRQAAFGVLTAYLSTSPEPFEDALQEVIDLKVMLIRFQIRGGRIPENQLEPQ